MTSNERNPVHEMLGDISESVTKLVEDKLEASDLTSGQKEEVILLLNEYYHFG